MRRNDDAITTNVCNPKINSKHSFRDGNFEGASIFSTAMETHGTIKKVVLITSGQPSLNPRLVKEADALTGVGIDVTVIYQYWNDWGTELDKSLLPSKRWRTVRVGGNGKKGGGIYFLTRVIHKAGQKLQKLIGPRNGVAELAVSRTTFLLFWEARKHVADFYIGHNIGALPATVWAGQYHKKPFGFDAEDFHRHEVSDDPEHSDVVLKKYLENKYFPLLNYLSAASPLISENYKRLFPEKKVVSILNVFPLQTIPVPGLASEEAPLRMFWFSQTIGPNRGLEEIINSVGRVNSSNIELHLLGDLKNEDRIYFKKIIATNNLDKQVFFYEPISSDAIISFASNFDIGIAAETGVPLNRDICLTNKIFTYIQAGLALIASDTTSQKHFFKQYPNLGFIYKKGQHDCLQKIITNYNTNRELLFRHRSNSYQYGQSTLNWQIESKHFLELLKTDKDLA